MPSPRRRAKGFERPSRRVGTGEVQTAVAGPRATGPSRRGGSGRTAATRPGLAKTMTQGCHGREGLCVQQGAIRRQGHLVVGQVGPGRWGCHAPAGGQLQREPWGILPPEVVHRSGKGTTNFTLVTLEDTNPNPPQV